MSTSSQNNQLIFSGAVFRSVILRKVNTPETESQTTKCSLIKFPDKTNVYFYFTPLKSSYTAQVNSESPGILPA